ncbi:MAG: cytochrome P450 [Pseudomonadota bacterium]|nr:cytochrome P450 [Pseudomonadota bacterium]MEC7238395.1 cytochrome P450 [Pseudomonadota bacterium]
MTAAPHFDIDMAALWHDPYPQLAKLREAAPIAFVPQLDGIVFTRRDDIDIWEKRVDVFSSEQPGGLMTRLMGKNMMRHDGAAHQTQRRAMQPAVSPRAVQRHWRSAFRDAAARILDDLAPRGAADLCVDYAMPLSGEALRLITGLDNVTAQQMDAHSQAMIDGISNYAGDADTEARCVAAVAALDRAIGDRLADFAASPPDPESAAGVSVIAVLQRSAASTSQIHANVKLVISGGQNEPRDAIAGAAWALMTHPEQLAVLRDGLVGWDRAFEEYVRWMAPIGMSPRRIAGHAEIDGVTIAPGGRAFFMFGAANRDPAHFVDPDRFDIGRDTRKHIAFGAGPHFCAGAFAARALVADVALPMMFERLHGLRLDTARPAAFGGLAFRGPLSVHVRWDAAPAVVRGE